MREVWTAREWQVTLKKDGRMTLEVMPMSTWHGAGAGG